MTVNANNKTKRDSNPYWGAAGQLRHQPNARSALSHTHHDAMRKDASEFKLDIFFWQLQQSGLLIASR